MQRTGHFGTMHSRVPPPCRGSRARRRRPASAGSCAGGAPAAGAKLGRRLSARTASPACMWWQQWPMTFGSTACSLLWPSTGVGNRTSRIRRARAQSLGRVGRAAIAQRGPSGAADLARIQLRLHHLRPLWSNSARPRVNPDCIAEGLTTIDTSPGQQHHPCPPRMQHHTPR